MLFTVTNIKKTDLKQNSMFCEWHFARLEEKEKQKQAFVQKKLEMVQGSLRSLISLF